MHAVLDDAEDILNATGSFDQIETNRPTIIALFPDKKVPRLVRMLKLHRKM